MTMLCFEDLHVGQKFTAGPVTLSEADLVAYASEFDPQPMHIDKEWADASPLGGLIASGWQTASVAMALQRAIGLPSTGLSEIASLAWPLPVRPGDAIQVEVEIKALAPSGAVQFQNTAANGAGHTVLIMLGTVLVGRRTSVTE